MSKRSCIICGSSTNYIICDGCENKNQDYTPKRFRIPSKLEYLIDNGLYRKDTYNAKEKSLSSSKYPSLENIAYKNSAGSLYKPPSSKIGYSGSKGSYSCASGSCASYK